MVLVDPDVDEDQRMSMRIDELPGPQPAGPDGRVGDEGSEPESSSRGGVGEATIASP